MASNLELLFTPAEFAALPARDLTQTVAVVFDVLRATSSILTALANGASAVWPVREIEDALALRRRDPNILLAGERNGVRIRAEQTGSIDFDLGNSPREFDCDKVQGRSLAMTTTNGTRALHASAGANAVLLGAFLNLEAVARWIDHRRPPHLLLVCSGTQEQASLEDVLAAGALCDRVWHHFAQGAIADSAEIARQIFGIWRQNLLGAMQGARNGRRLLANPELREDVAFCLNRNSLDLVATLQADGAVRRWAPEGAPKPEH
jgi:2-phosphosulfolactate phosphatase